MRRLCITLIFLMQLNQLFAAGDLDYLDKEGAAFCRELANKVGVHPPQTSADIYLQRIKNLVLSDRVGFYFNIDASVQDGRLVLTGDCERQEFKIIAREVFKELGFSQIEDHTQVLPDLVKDPDPFGVVAKPFVLTHSKPDLSGLPMDEALFGEPVYLLKETNGVTLFKTFTGYWGFGPSDAIKRVTRKEFIHFVNGSKVLIKKDYRKDGLFIPAGSRLVLTHWGMGSSCQVDNPMGGSLDLPKRICQRHLRDKEIEKVIATAMSYFKAPYNLGGKNSSTGIDCSGLILMSYRTIGLNLARDAKQQYLGGNLIPPYLVEALMPGDAVYFINSKGQVDHTGLYIGQGRIIHATGTSVRIQSIDPKAPDYLDRFQEDFIGAKRFWW